MEVSEFDPLFVEFRNNISDDFCNHLIEKFEGDDRKGPGLTHVGVNPDWKTSTDLHITPLEEWKEEDDTLYEHLSKAFSEYVGYVYDLLQQELPINSDKGYQIQKTEPDGFYKHHYDAEITNPFEDRILTYIWYLNEPMGGETKFWWKGSVKPETGKLLLFPSTWNNIHEGTPPLTDKYICTGWALHTYQQEDEGTTEGTV